MERSTIIPIILLSYIITIIISFAWFEHNFISQTLARGHISENIKSSWSVVQTKSDSIPKRISIKAIADTIPTKMSPASLDFLPVELSQIQNWVIDENGNKTNFGGICSNKFMKTKKGELGRCCIGAAAYEGVQRFNFMGISQGKSPVCPQNSTI